MMANLICTSGGKEVVEEKRSSGQKGLVCKIDFEKGYNYVGWNFWNFFIEKERIWGQVEELDQRWFPVFEFLCNS